MSLNEITTLVFSLLTLVFVIYGFILFVRIAHRLIRALDLYIIRHGGSSPEKESTS